MQFPDQIRYDENGLVPVVVQDQESARVLMLAYMNHAALEQTLATRRVTYWSRSRQAFWVKGATSGFVQHVREVYVNCENNSLLILVEQVGAACHEGYRSCYFRRVSDDGEALETVDTRLVDPY